MVGKAVLFECLEHPDIESVLVINRQPLELSHPKLKEVIHGDFTDFSPIKDSLKGYDACFHNMGVSAMGMTENDYSRLTYDVTKNLADTLFELSPNLVFTYVSGEGTDSTENGRFMWARVKGKTENMLFKKGFKDVYAFRPGAIVPEKGVKPKAFLSRFFYALLSPVLILLKNSKYVTTSTRVGQVMIHVLSSPIPNKTLSNADINQISRSI